MKKLLSLVLLSIATACLCSCSNEEKRTPLGWCVWEIQTHEGYEECTFTYQEIEPKSYKLESKNALDCYIITTYTEELRGEWLCYVEYNKKAIEKYLTAKDVYSIDCDLVWEINYEEWGGESF